MNVRHKLLGGYLIVAAMLAVTGVLAWRADVDSAKRAAVTEAVQVARGIGADVAQGLAADTAGEKPGPLYDDPIALDNYLKRLHDLQQRDVVVVDRDKRILADAVPENVGTTFDHDTANEVGRTIADGRSRTFVEVSVDYPDGIRQVVVPLVSAEGETLGAVILEYTPLYDQMMAVTAQAQRLIIVSGTVCTVLVLVIGWFIARSVTRRITSLTSAVGAVRNGDYSRRVPLVGRDEITGLGMAFNDMAAQLETSAQEILAKEYTDSILANAGEGICGVDATNRITFANAAACRLTGLDVTELLHQDVATLLPDAGGDDVPASGSRESPLVRPDGTSVRVAYTISPITKAGRRIGAVIVLRDVTRQRALEHDLRHQALHDGLTGLPNRKLFVDRLEHAMAKSRATGERIAVLFLDLDGFKRVNDGLGHDAGDSLLRDAAVRLRAVLRPHDTVARQGGDEFAALLEGADDATVDRLAQACLDTLAAPFRLIGREVNVTVSIGVVSDASRYADADEAIRNADMAMYAAKGQGKARYRLFESTMHERLVERMDREARLRAAVPGGELRLHLQPVVDLVDRRMRGVEALVRWEDPELGLLPPAAFVPLAEETGLIVDIDRWVLVEACRTLRNWLDRAPDTAPSWISVNLSAAHLELPDLTDHVAQALAASGLPADCLVLEVTETVLMSDIAVSSTRLEQLRRLGVRIAIDDFGTGYSSLGYLRDIPVDVLKIDRSFITGLVDSARQRDLVTAVVQLGHTLGLRVVVEGVEDEAQLALLVSIGCRLAQGYHLGRPELAESLAERVAVLVG
jgi:diguanylate cyclase (GGDEF)-like protein/PAS domain S-box-containing protein